MTLTPIHLCTLIALSVVQCTLRFFLRFLCLSLALPSDIALSVDPLQSIMPARLYNDLQSYIFFPIPLREMLMLTRIQPAYIDAAKNLNGPGLDDRKFLVSVALS